MNLLLGVLLGVLRELGNRSPVPPARPLAAQLAAWAGRHGSAADPAVALHAILIWSRLHGLVRLGIAGNSAAMGPGPDQLFEAQLAALTG